MRNVKISLERREYEIDQLMKVKWFENKICMQLSLRITLIGFGKILGEFRCFVKTLFKTLKSRRKINYKTNKFINNGGQLGLAVSRRKVLLFCSSQEWANFYTVPLSTTGGSHHSLQSYRTFVVGVGVWGVGLRPLYDFFLSATTTGTFFPLRCTMYMVV